MKTIKERIEREKKNALFDVKWYEEHGIKAKYGKRQRMADIWARTRYELSKLMIKAIDEEDSELYETLHKWDNLWCNKLPKIRSIAVIMASNGQKMLETELNNDEIIRARKIANEKVNEWLKGLTKEAV